jgi:type II secretory pathway pseudopilin PulG
VKSDAGLAHIFSIVGSIFVLAVSICLAAVAVYAVAFLYDELTARKAQDAEAFELHQMRARVGEAGRWLSWYFPIAEDIEQYILGERGRIDGFRDELWAAYGKRDTSEPVAATKEAVRR